MSYSSHYSFRAKLWRWKGEAPASWVFVTLPIEVAFDIRMDAGTTTKAWGSVAVEATIGGSVWRTSLFREKDSGSYVLPLKASVRKAEGLHDGDEAEVSLRLV